MFKNKACIGNKQSILKLAQSLERKSIFEEQHIGLI
jgi:hypothetical protein